MSKGADTTGPVAVVNGEEVTRDQYKVLEDQVKAEQGTKFALLSVEDKAKLQTQIIDTLVSQALLRQAIAKANITVTDEQVAQQMTAIRGQFADETAYTQALTAQNLTEDGLRDQVRTELTTQAYFEQTLKFSTITVTDEEIVTAYEQVAASQENVPALEEAREQVRGLLVQQKQQELVNAHIEQLRGQADVEVLI
jgi:hypothetical protein